MIEHFESKNEERPGRKDSMSRREFLKGAGAASVFLCPCVQKALAQEEDIPSRYENGWFFTPEQMKKIYNEEYNAPEKLLPNCIRKEGDAFIGIFRGQEFVVPQAFLDKTLTNLKALLEQKTARYLFRLDAFHFHSFVFNDHYKKKYEDLNFIEEIKTLMEDSHLGALFHNSEHLYVSDGDTESKEIFERRNVFGWYDGRPLEILPLPEQTEFKKPQAVSVPDNATTLVPPFGFSAHRDGIFTIVFNGEKINLDLSFDSDLF